MNTSELNQLKTRWIDKRTSKHAAGFIGERDSPFPMMDDGFVDLRGLEITQFIKYVTVDSIDLSGAELEKFGQFLDCKIRNVRFCYAALQTNLGSSFNLCNFNSAKLSGAVMRGEFVDCDFSNANLTSAMGRQVRFIRCVFLKTNFSKAMFIHCSFEDCQIEECKFVSGSLANSKFIRSPILNGDLKNTLMEKVVST